MLPGLFFGVAVIVVYLLSEVIKLVGNWREAAGTRRKSEIEARAIFLLLNEIEKRLLVELITSNQTLFEVHMPHIIYRHVEPAGILYPLVRKGILLAKRQLGDDLFCELHPGIVANKREILRGRW